MASGRTEEMWNHTAALMWIVYSVNRGPKSEKLSIEDFHPRKAGRPKGVPITKANFYMLKALVPKKPNPKKGRT